MAWNAKPKGGYAYDSNEAKENYTEIYNALSSSWSLSAVCGAIGNMWGESGFNPWRWQGDKVNYNMGYGLVQFTKASSYFNIGSSYPNYSPNTSVATQTTGATPADGYAQCKVLENDALGKWINRSSYCPFLNISSTANLNNYKALGDSDLYLATVSFLFHYEGNKVVLYGNTNAKQKMADDRYWYAYYAFQYLQGTTPSPTPPPTPPSPTPPPLITKKNMPVYMMCRKI